MIEDGLFLLLGLSLATLVALACLPLVWARALHLTHARLARMVPTSQAEIDAAHDGLRAQAAVVHRRLEQRIEVDQHAAAQVKSELGRRTVSLLAAEAAGEALRAEYGALRGEFAEQLRDMRDGEGQRVTLEKALHDADATAEAAQADAAVARQRLADASARGHRQDIAIEALEARVTALTAEIADGSDRVVALEAVAAQHARAELAVEAAFELKRNEAERLKTALSDVQEALRQAHQTAEAREQGVRHQTDVLAAAETRMKDQDAMLKQRQADLSALRLRIEALEGELKARGESTLDDEPDDARLRGEIVAIGDNALRLLQPAEREIEPVGGKAEPVGERQL